MLLWQLCKLSQDFGVQTAFLIILAFPFCFLPSHAFHGMFPFLDSLVPLFPVISADY